MQNDVLVVFYFFVESVTNFKVFVFSLSIP